MKNFKDIKTDIEKKTWHARVKISQGAKQFKEFCIEHPEVVATAIPVMLSCGKKIYKLINNAQQETIKEKYVYDPSLGHYWELKRKLRNDEWVYIEKRKANGEKMGDILKSLNVLK